MCEIHNIPNISIITHHICYYLTHLFTSHTNNISNNNTLKVSDWCLRCMCLLLEHSEDTVHRICSAGACETLPVCMQVITIIYITHILLLFIILLITIYITYCYYIFEMSSQFFNLCFLLMYIFFITYRLNIIRSNPL